MVNLIKIAWTS